jgi:hypothetical protein
MISTPEGVTPLDSQQILWFFHHTDYSLIPISGTDKTGIVFGDAEADGTKAHPPGNFQKGFSQSVC